MAGARRVGHNMLVTLDEVLAAFHAAPRLTAASPREPTPSEFGDIALHPHQQALLARMRAMEAVQPDGSFQTLGVLADPPGSGKSYTMLALTQHTPHLRNTACAWSCFNRPNVGMQRVLAFRRVVPFNLIVTPHGGVLEQWRQYLRACMPGGEYVCVARRAHLEPLRDRVDTVRVVLVASTFYRPVLELLDDMGIDRIGRVVFDEADTLCLSNLRIISAAFYWHITASPSNLVLPDGSNRLQVDGLHHNGFLRQTFRAVFAHATHEDGRVFSTLFARCDPAFVAASFPLPPPVERTHVCRDPHALHLLRDDLYAQNQRAVEMLHAGDVHGAIQALGGTCTDSAAGFAEALTLDLTRRLIHTQARQDYLAATGADTERVRAVEQQTERLREQMRSVAQRVSELSEQSCPICLDPVGSQGPVAAPPCCGQMFCTRCLLSAMERWNRCPMCRSDLAPSALIVKHEQVVATANQAPRLPTKLEALYAVVGANPAGRFLIFSCHDRTFDQIGEQLRSGAARVGHISGNASCVNATLRRFRTGELNVLLLDATHFGQGCNLETATDAVLMHKMPAELEAQVIGRAQRPGRTDTLRVHRLLHERET
jgi:hypothetical protein